MSTDGTTGSSAQPGKIPCVSIPSHLTTYLAATTHTRAEVLQRPSPVPVAPGVYAWWFRTLPADIDTSKCEQRDGLTLLYTGISPSRPPANGKPPSRQNLRKRIRTHYTGNAEGSTLRRTLGCLLAEELGLEMRRYGSGHRRHFGAGEQVLSQWMADNALVSWIVHPEPWEIEHQIIQSIDVPLNLDGNAMNAYHPTLSAIRRMHLQRANGLAVLPNPGVGGR